MVEAASPAVRAAVCTPSRAVSAAVPAAEATVSAAADAPRRSRLEPRLIVAAKAPNGSSATLRVAPTSACTGVAWIADVPVRPTSVSRASSHSMVAVCATSRRSKTGMSW